MFGDLGKIMKLAGQVRSKLPEMREQLAKSQYTGQSGGGVVWATVNGRMSLVDLKINRSALAGGGEMDDARLVDLIKVAVNDAQRQALEAAAEAMRQLTGGVEIPGLDGML